MHLDEKTALAFSVIVRGKVVKTIQKSEREFFREEYSLNAKRWGPDFLRDLHTRHAEHNQKLGLKRGKPNSGAVHKPVKDYYAELDKREKELTEGLEKYKARGELVAKAKTYMAQAKAKWMSNTTRSWIC